MNIVKNDPDQNLVENGPLRSMLPHLIGYTECLPLIVFMAIVSSGLCGFIFYFSQFHDVAQVVIVHKYI